MAAEAEGGWRLVALGSWVWWLEGACLSAAVGFVCSGWRQAARVARGRVEWLESTPKTKPKTAVPV